MKRRLLSVALAALSGVAAAAPQQWSGNGHWYEYISDALTWQEALVAAQGLSFNGMTGYLATLTSAEENRFASVTVAGGQLAWIADQGMPQFTADGHCTGFLVYGWDITARRAAEGGSARRGGRSVLLEQAAAVQAEVESLANVQVVPLTEALPKKAGPSQTFTTSPATSSSAM